MNRRRFLRWTAGSAVLSSWAVASGCCSTSGLPPQRTFATRGVVLVPEDLSLTDWPARAAGAGLTTVALHHQNSPARVIEFIHSAAGEKFLAECHRHRLHVEYELHAMKELLPRHLFQAHPEWFRMNTQAARVPDANCCVHQEGALETILRNAVRIARVLTPTTGRFFYWGDDGEAWCRCPRCREFSDSDQALLLENSLVKALRAVHRQASLAHLAYANTLPPPQHVRPAQGVFLEYAPIQRRYDVPYAQQTGTDTKDGLPLLDANLAIFPRATTQVLEYWLDVSRFSSWRRPAVRLPWNPEVFQRDLDTYAARGIRHVTSFAVWVDRDYQGRFGEPDFVRDYGRWLSVRRSGP